MPMLWLHVPPGWGGLVSHPEWWLPSCFAVYNRTFFLELAYSLSFFVPVIYPCGFFFFFFCWVPFGDWCLNSPCCHHWGTRCDSPNNLRYLFFSLIMAFCCPVNSPTFFTQKSVDFFFLPIFRPPHPGVHYLIHTYDFPVWGPAFVFLGELAPHLPRHAPIYTIISVTLFTIRSNRSLLDFMRGEGFDFRLFMSLDYFFNFSLPQTNCRFGGKKPPWLLKMS